MRTTLLTAFAAFPALLAAQNTVVSPVAAATTGGGGNSYPWSQGPMHYMQVHSDIKNQFRLINQIGFRMSPGTSTYTGTRAIDLELFMGDTVDYDAVQTTFTANYTGTPQLVVTRKIVNMGPQGTQAQPISPFAGMDIPFDTPFPYLGTKSLGWEVRIYSNTLTGTFSSSDALSSSNQAATVSTTGAGCTASGKTSPMTMTASLTQTCYHLTTIFGLTNGPNSAVTVLALGTTNPNQSFPGLCGPLYTDLAAILNVGTTDATGAIPRGGSASFYFKTNPAPGATVYAQAHSLDVGSSQKIPVANSNGTTLILPTLVPANVMEVTRLYLAGNPTGAVASIDYYGVIGYGLATQFRY